MSILTNNALQIREPLEVHCGLMAVLGATVSYTITGDVALEDTNASETIQQQTWNVRRLADFAYGIPMDGSVSLLNGTTGSENVGKIGIRSDVGPGTITISGTASREIPAVTMVFTRGTGTIECGTFSSPIRPSVVIPVNDDSFTITIENTGEGRVEISDVIPGVAINFTNEDLISVALDLRSNLDIIGPSFELSTIEIQAYWPDDIAEAVANLGDDMPVWYYSGIDGDYSPTRHFYLADKVTQENNVIRIVANDKSELLDDSRVSVQRLAASERKTRKALYNWFVGIIEDAGIQLVTKEAAPSNTNLGNETTLSLVFLDGSARDHVANIMCLCRCPEYDFYPRYVDAGIPKVSWSTPVPQWTIREEDVGDLQETIDRNIARIKTTSDYGLWSTAWPQDESIIIESDIEVTNNRRTTKNFSEWYWKYSVNHKKNDAFVWTRPDTVQWISNYTGKVTLRGWPIDVNVFKTTLDPSVYGMPKRYGYTEEDDPKVVGLLTYSYNYCFPNYAYAFQRDNRGGSFTWKGDPKMQPRDVFNFVRLDGSVEVCTIETIQLKHEKGGTIAEIAYRRGLV